MHSSHLLQPLDVGCFAVIKRVCSRFVSDLARTGYNHIDKYDFLENYQHARLEAFEKPSIIQNSFAASGLVPVDSERVLSKLNISQRTPTPPSSRPISRSSQFTPKMPRTVVQLQKQSSTLMDLLHQRSKSSPSPINSMINQIFKGSYISLHGAALLALDNANLRAANKKIVKKGNRPTNRVPCEEGLTINEGLQLVEQLLQLVEDDRVVSHGQGELPIQADPPRTRAPPRCIGCREIGHRINVQYVKIAIFS